MSLFLGTWLDLGGGNVGGGGITAPTIAVVEPVTNPAAFDIGLGSGLGAPYDTAAGDYVQLRIDGSTIYTSSALSAGDITAGTIEIANGTLTAASHYAHARIRRGDGSPGTIYSAWSAQETFTAPANFSAAYTGSGTSTTSGTTHTMASVAIGTADSDRSVFAAVLAEDAAEAVTAISSATIGGVAATVVTEAYHSLGGNRIYCGIIRALVPSGTTAAVVPTFDSSVARSACAAYSVLGFSSVDDSASDTISFPNTDFSLALDVVGNGFVIGAIASGGTSPTGIASIANGAEDVTVTPTGAKLMAFSESISTTASARSYSGDLDASPEQGQALAVAIS